MTTPVIALITLDDGQVISGPLNELSQHEIISLANQYRRNKNNSVADTYMRYQHEKFNKPPKKAA